MSETKAKALSLLAAYRRATPAVPVAAGVPAAAVPADKKHANNVSDPQAKKTEKERDDQENGE